MTAAAPTARVLAVAALLAPLTLYPALVNGAPLVFSDSASYLNRFRDAGLPPFYAAFIRILGLAGRLEPVLTAQAFVAASAVVLTLARAGSVRRTATLVALGGCAILLNQLPWLASWLMPDLFTGIGGIALLLLVLVPERLPRLERLGLALVLFGCSLMASANMPLFLGLLLFTAGARMWLMRERIAIPTVALALLAIAGAVGTTFLANKAIHGRWQLNSGGPALTFSRLVDIGVAQPVVARECARNDHAICPHQAAIARSSSHAQVFLWEGPAEWTAARTTNAAEFARLNSLILRESWPAVLLNGAAESVTLFTRPTLGNLSGKPEADGRELSPFGKGHVVAKAMERRFPAHAPAHLSARQQRGEFKAAFPALPFAFSTYAGYVLLAVLLGMRLARGDKVGAAIALSALALVAGQILLHATLVGPFARYHVKVAWVAWPLVLALLSRLWAAGAAQAPPQFLLAPAAR